MKKVKRPILSIILLAIFFFIPLLGGIFLSRSYQFSVAEDIVMAFVVLPIEAAIFIFIIALWNKQNINEWGDESDYFKSNHHQRY